MPKSSAAPNQAILEAALQGLEAQREKLDEQIAQVRSMIGRRGPAAKKNAGSSQASSGQSRTRRSLSPEARRRIAAAQKKRWAAFRKAQQ